MKTRFFSAPLLAVVLGLAFGACFDSPIIMEEQSGAPENQGNPDDNTFAGGDSSAADSLGTPLGGSDSSTQNPHVGSGDPDTDTTTAGVNPADDPATIGSTWITVTSATSIVGSRTLFDVVWGGGRFVAVGQGGTILSSVDGERWTAAVSGVSHTLRAIVWAPPANTQAGRFVAVGDEGTVLISTDAEAWTQVAPGVQATPALTSGMILEDVAWNGSVFTIVGYQHFNGGLQKAAEAACCVPKYRTSNTIATSSDGFTWVERHYEPGVVGLPAPSTDVWQAVAVAGDGRMMAMKRGGSALISTDGINWVAGAPVGSGGFFSSLEWGGTATGQGWVAVGGLTASPSSGVQIKVSADGSAWHHQGGHGQTLNAVTWAGSRFVAVGAGGTFLVSDGSVTWTARSTGTNLALMGVAYRTSAAKGAGSGARLVAVGVSGTIVRSP